MADLFLISYFSQLALNNINLSGLQSPKNIIDIYYFTFGAIILYVILKYVKIHYNSVHVFPVRVKLSTIAIVLTILYILGKFITIKVTGVRLFSDSWQTMENSMFVIPGLGGFLRISMWLLLMFIPSVEKKLKILILFTVYVFVILNANRGDIIRVSCFIVILWMGKYGKELFKKENIIKIVGFVLSVLILFGMWGNYREQKRNSSVYKTGMQKYLDSNIDNDIVNWLYAYSAINFDVMKNDYENREASWKMEAIFQPLVRLIGGNREAEEYEKSVFIDGLNGFNGMPFVGAYIHELRLFYFADVVILGLLFIVFDTLFKQYGLIGGRYFLMMFAVLQPTYIHVPNSFFTLIATLIILFFSKRQKLQSKGRICQEDAI